MAPFEALYGRKCRSPICWNDYSENVVLGTEFIEETIKNVRLIQARIQAAQDRQKSYADLKRRVTSSLLSPTRHFCPTLYFLSPHLHVISSLLSPTRHFLSPHLHVISSLLSPTRHFLSPLPLERDFHLFSQRKLNGIESPKEIKKERII